ncbi:MAG: hypothetical protein GY703_19340 [Gammaproteobacteria bacterium]|nr:hypothetical protein [Gammaproteobacteria bacterium]
MTTRNTTASAGHFETGDIEEQTQAARPWEVAHHQMSPGKFRVSTDYFCVNGVICYRQHWTKRTLVRGTSPNGFLMLGCSFAPETGFKWYGEHLNMGCLALVQSGTELEFVIPDNSRHWAVLIPVERLSRYTDPDIPANDQDRKFRQLKCSPRTGLALTSQILGIIEKY